MRANVRLLIPEPVPSDAVHFTGVAEPNCAQGTGDVIEAVGFTVSGGAAAFSQMRTQSIWVVAGSRGDVGSRMLPVMPSP